MRRRLTLWHASIAAKYTRSVVSEILRLIAKGESGYGTGIYRKR